ncbi:hypothetical protein HII28_19530 [Planctomonas sp. JC2975]|uniref:hypothetical protein n=1 Tax=Planctomonas sp. JC2975 TaxID=2729626 RepID=UPI0014749358|nr:hypothetical protein [Planctomonas sp. JC2975]NNC14055.1 hypothetical protein [Planctomonas sp. JC2975]
MSETEQASLVERKLGGEAGHRSFFGGGKNGPRNILLVLCGLVLMVGTPFFGAPAVVTAVVAAIVVFIVTARTHRGSILERRTKRSRWVHRGKAGLDRYEPFDVARWDQLSQSVQDKAISKHDRWAASRELAAMRTMPDGADGMGWLQMGRREPGISWHSPFGEPAYLSVSFTVTGQLRGAEPNAVARRAAIALGEFLASKAAPSSLLRRVQITTRVLPPDTAFNEAWAQVSLDPEIPKDHPAVLSYSEVLRITGKDSMVQRHTVTACWPIDAAFLDAASSYGHGRDGWRALMSREIDSAERGLRAARLGDVAVLTARQTAAHIRHQQDPFFPLDQPVDDPTRIGVASHDEFSAHVVTTHNPATGAPVEWWHRTAAIKAEHLAVGDRSQLWLLDLLIGADLRFLRTVTFHHQLIPAGEARAAARRDLVRDTAAQMGDIEAGRLANDETQANKTAAQLRKADLDYGSRHHGDTWIGYVTITETSRDALQRASRLLEEVCENGLGIEQLDWQDSYQSAASGTTWPIGRGIATERPSVTNRVYRKLAGKSNKEAL